MILNFEEITYELTDEEERLLPKVVEVLAKHVGKHNTINNQQIRYWTDVKDGPRLRKIIHEIRVRGILPRVCSTSRGYFVAGDRQELEECLTSLRQRLSSIGAVYEALLGQG